MASKLLSLGALLVALDPIYRNEVTIFNVNASEYTIKVPIDTFINKNELSEPYLVWSHRFHGFSQISCDFLGGFEKKA